jgi:hypothetical protein
LVILAHRYDTTRIVSFDERHFRTVTPLQGGAFTILPAPMPTELHGEFGTTCEPGRDPGSAA